MSLGRKKTAALLGGVAALMVGLSFAAVPLYDLFCRVTGFAGTTSVATNAPGQDQVLEQTIRVRFDASIDAGMPWEFKPVQRVMELRIGETALAYYHAHNPTDRAIKGTATYNVTPDAAGGYFSKIDCFCFTEQELGPGESIDMPVSFFVDPEIVKDPEGRFLKEITLSYTFYQVSPEQEEQQAALAVLGSNALR